MAAHPGLCSLADLDFDGVRLLEILRRHAVFIGYVLEDILVGRGLLLRQYSALAAAHGSPGHGASLCQRHLHLLRHRSEGHMGYVDRSVQHHGLFRALADHRGDIHRIVLHQRRRIQLRTQNQDIIPIWHGHLCAHGIDNRLPAHRHLMDLFHIAAGAVLSRILWIVFQAL